MTFEKLYRIITEAKDEKPGMRYHSARSSAGPAGIVSGPIGKSDSLEVSKPQKRWEFDTGAMPSYDEEGKARGKASGKQVEAKKWVELANAFTLLQNDPSFGVAVDELAKNFDRQRHSYRNLMLGNEEGPKKYDEESKIETLSRNLAKYKGQTETLRDDIRKYKRGLKWSSMGQGSREVLELKTQEGKLEGAIKGANEYMKSKENADMYGEVEQLSKDLDREKDNLEKFKKVPIGLKGQAKNNYDKAQIDIARTKVNIKELMLKLSTGKLKKFKALYDDTERNLQQLKAIREKLNLVQGGPAARARYEDFLQQAEDKYTDLTQKETETEAELNDLLDRVNSIGQKNMENNDAAVAKFIEQMKLSAKRVSEMIAQTTGEVPNESGDIDWNVVPESLKVKKQMADSLALDDDNNPIIAYLDSVYRRNYGISENIGSIYDPNTNSFSPAKVGAGELAKTKDLDSREFNKNVNITSMRDYNSLPFVRLLATYANAKHKMSLKPTDIDVDADRFQKFWKKLDDTIKLFPNTSDPEKNYYMQTVWDNRDTKNKLEKVITNLGLSEQLTTPIITALYRPWSVSRTGANPFQQLGSVLASQTKGIRKKLNSDSTPIYPTKVTESFDTFVSSIMETTKYDVDDLKIGIMEIFKK